MDDQLLILIENSIDAMIRGRYLWVYAILNCVSGDGEPGDGYVNFAEFEIQFRCDGINCILCDEYFASSSDIFA